jgi:uncharacterized membrane protein
MLLPVRPDGPTRPLDVRGFRHRICGNAWPLSRHTPGRLQTLDAARGIAMLFVCLAHFSDAYARSARGHDLDFAILQHVAMLASPTFVLISGLLLGVLYQMHPEAMPTLKAKLVDRGLFLLTIGHLLIVVAHVPIAGGLGAALQWGFITDVIGFGLLFGPALVERTTAKTRLTLAIAAYTLSWIVVVGWRPPTAGLERVKEYVFGAVLLPHLGPRLVVDCFPFIPWLALYVAATALGERLGTLLRAASTARASRLLTRLALACLVAAVAGKAVPLGLQWLGWLPPSELTWVLTWPFQKQPPSLVYLGLFGGLGLLMVRAVLAIEARPALGRWLALPAAVGRASLAVFIVQYYVYFSVIAWWGPPFSVFWPLLFAASLAIVVGVALQWERYGNNDIFSVGYRRLVPASPRPRIAA